MTELDRELEVAVNLARKAGEAILCHYNAGDVNIQFKDKAQTDPVTDADKEANEIIVQGLAKAFPHDACLAEESPLDANRFSYKRMWCVDPLDGTRDFISRTGEFSVMIGLVIHGEARLGVVYHPTEDRMYAGYGNRARIQYQQTWSDLEISRVNHLSDSVLMVSRSHRSQTIDRVANELGISKTRPMGSVGLKVAEIAAGRAEVYASVSDRTQEWDACAPEAILRAAGGIMTDIHGRPLRYNKQTPNTPYGMLANNGLVHEPLLRTLSKLAQEHHQT